MGLGSCGCLPQPAHQLLPGCLELADQGVGVPLVLQTCSCPAADLTSGAELQVQTAANPAGMLLC